MTKVFRVVRDELIGLQINLVLSSLILKLIPAFAGGRVRVKILQITGFHIGQNSVIMGNQRFIGNGNIVKNLRFGRFAFVNVECFFDLAAPIIIGENVSVGPQTMFITGAHQVGVEDKRCGSLEPRTIIVGDGVWIGARSIILPGVSIGRGSVIAAGAVVTRDVPVNTMVAGVPARVIKSLPLLNEAPVTVTVSANGNRASSPEQSTSN